MTTTQSTEDTATLSPASARWRTVDIVVASAIGVAFGVVFWAWGHLWNTARRLHLVPAGPGLHVRRVADACRARRAGHPQARRRHLHRAVAATVSALLGVSWGLSVVAYGVVEGAAAEIVFAFALYRSWRLVTALLAGAVAGLAAAMLDILFYYPKWSGGWQLSYALLLAASSALIAGAGSWLLVFTLRSSLLPSSRLPFRWNLAERSQLGSLLEVNQPRTIRSSSTISAIAASACWLRPAMAIWYLSAGRPKASTTTSEGFSRRRAGRNGCVCSISRCAITR